MDAELARTRIEQTLTMLALPVAEHLATLADFFGMRGADIPGHRPGDATHAVARNASSTGTVASTGGEPAHALPAP